MDIISSRRVRASVAALALIGTLGATAGLVGAQDPTTTTTDGSTTTTEAVTTTTSAPEREGSLDISADFCEVTITATVNTAGYYVIEIWDDGAVIEFWDFETAGADSHTVHYTFTVSPGDEAPGVGISLSIAESYTLDNQDPYIPELCTATTTTEATTTSEGATTTTGTPAPNTPAQAGGAEAVAGSPSYTG